MYITVFILYSLAAVLFNLFTVTGRTAYAIHTVTTNATKQDGRVGKVMFKGKRAVAREMENT